MTKSLGIFVSSDKHLDKLIEVCKAARKKGVRVTIFLTHFGVLLTKTSRFQELQGLAGISLCRVAFEGQGLAPPVSGIDEKDYATQARHGEIIEDCKRYLVF